MANSSLLAMDHWLVVTPEQRRAFAPLCHDLVVVLASPGR